MTLTSAEAAKMQKHNADLVRENETLTRDNAEFRRQVDAIKQKMSVLTCDDACENELVICFACDNRGCGYWTFHDCVDDDSFKHFTPPEPHDA